MSSTEKDLQSRSDGRRILSFDSLRGIAACFVILQHFRMCFFEGPPRWFVRPFVSGTASVILFFVLSGYVLSIPYWNPKHKIGYRPYVLRRFCRIYMPYAFAAVMALAAASLFFNQGPPLTEWFQRTWHTPVTAATVLRILFLGPNLDQINTAFWSLRYEMEFSLLLPLLCALFRLLPSWSSLLFAIGVGVLGRVLQGRAGDGTGRLELGLTLIWFSCFFYGMFLSWQQHRLQALYARVPGWGRLLLLAAACVTFATPRLMLLPGAACVLLLTARYTRVGRWLSTPFPEYLGRVSYSLYLVHATVLFATVILLHGRLPVWLIFVVYVVAAFAVAHLFCTQIEERFIKLGKTVAGSHRKLHGSTV